MTRAAGWGLSLSTPSRPGSRATAPIWSIAAGIRRRRIFLPIAASTTNLVFNPPFDLAREFALQALLLARNKVAMIFPTARLNAASWLEGTPLVRVWLMTPRPSMLPGARVKAGEKPGGGKSDYVWLVWDWRNRNIDDGGWTDQPELRWLQRDVALL